MSYRTSLPVVLVLSPVSVFAPSSAAAYSTGTIVSDACHEEMTQDALAHARTEVGALPLPAPSDDERALLADLPFELDDELYDLAAASLVLGNRDVDFRGNEADDLETLAPLHGAPGRQAEHCLRTSAQDGLQGSQQALAACRAYISQRIDAALEGVESGGGVDFAHRTKLRVPLDIRGPVDVRLPTYYVEMGRALHTIQDGFSHTFRSDDHQQVVTVLNYVELVEDTHDESRDGPEHLSPLDECHSLDGYRSERKQVATRATREFLVATLEPGLDNTERRANADALLADYFSHAGACDASNSWCDAPENRYENPAAPGCSVANSGSAPGELWWAVPWLGLGLLGMRRSQSVIRRGRRGALQAVGALMLTTLAWPAPAHAQAQTEETANSADPDPAQDPVAASAVAREDARLDTEKEVAWGAAANVSGAISEPAFAWSLGARYRLDVNWLFGLDVEHNPWYADNTSRFRPGVVSAYGSVMLRFPMRFERVNLRSTLQLGASRMMFDLFGVPEGTIGPYIGFNLLGIDYELTNQLYLVVNPAHIALPIPQTTGAPYSYPQYRLTLGLQFGA